MRLTERYIDRFTELAYSSFDITPVFLRDVIIVSGTVVRPRLFGRKYLSEYNAERFSNKSLAVSRSCMTMTDVPVRFR